MVQDYCEVIKLVSSCKIERLPDCSFLAFTISDKHKNPSLLFFELPCKSHAYSYWQAMTKASCGALNALASLNIRVRAYIRRITFSPQHAVPSEAAMPLTKNELILVLWLDHSLVQRNYNLNWRERRSNMPFSEFYGNLKASLP